MEIIKLNNPTHSPHWFNGGIVDAFGKRLAMYRVSRWPTVLGLSELSEDYKLSPPVLYPELRDGMKHQAEDPRLIYWNDELYCIYTEVRPEFTSRMRIATIDKNYKITSNYVCKCDGLMPAEKNWSPFISGDKLHVIYSTVPGRVLVYAGAGNWTPFSAPGLELLKAPNESPWQYGEIRGGTNIVEHAGEFYHFFHSARGLAGQKVYYMGCYTFDRFLDAKRLTHLPLLFGNIEEATMPWGPRWGYMAACFACGAILENDSWLISYGWLDSALRLLKIPNAELQDALYKI